MSMSHGPAPDAAPRPTDEFRHRCPECLATFVPVHPSQLFCTTAHRDGFHNRQTKRGRSLVPLALAARLTRGGTRRDIATGIRARQDVERLLDRWNAEDRAAKPPRMPMDAYIRLRLAKGFEPA